MLIDACVLYPTILREIVTGIAGRGLFVPLWSAHILEEWARATVKLGPGAEDVARGEIALLRAGWPDATVAPPPDWTCAPPLPDPDDTHVLAAAVTGRADLILTLNLRDFPARTLAPHGLRAVPPDGFVLGLMNDHPRGVTAVIAAVHALAESRAGAPLALRAVLKRASLPRVAKSLAAV